MFFCPVNAQHTTTQGLGLVNARDSTRRVLERHPKSDWDFKVGPSIGVEELVGVLDG